MKLSEIQQPDSTASPKKLSQIKQANSPAVQSDHGFLGNVAADIVKPFARMGTNLVNAGQIIAGQETTKPFSGSFLGDVKPVGMEDGGGLSVKNLKDSIGVGADIASNIPMVKGAGITFNLLKDATKSGGMSALKKAAVPLVKEGVAAGSLFSGGKALQENKTLGQTLIDTAIGGAVGGVSAPVFGAGGALLGKGLGKYTNMGKLFKGEESRFAKEAAEKDVSKIAEYVRPPLNAAEKLKLKGEKRGTEYGGLFGLGDKKFKVGEEDMLMAHATKDLVDPRMSQADANIDRILKNVTDVHDNELMPFLRENPNPYNWIDLKNYLDNHMKVPKLLTSIDPEAGTAIRAIKQRGLEIVGQFPKTQEGIQQARTAIDNMIKDELGPAFFDKAHPKNAGVKQAVLKLRTVLNDFTHDSLRVGDIPTLNKVETFMKEAQKRGIKMDNPQMAKEELLKFFGTDVIPENELNAIIFRNTLKNMNLKLKAADNIWLNSAKEVGKSKFRNLTKDPLVRTGVGLGVGYGLGQVFGGGIGSASGNNSN